MIETLQIDRFKSIRSLSLPCRKVNVFIGAPDTGKTNILEALYFLSRLGWGLPLDTSLRLRQELGFDPLFYQQFFDQPLQIAMKLKPPFADFQAEKLTVQVSISGGQERSLVISIPEISRSAQVGFGSTCDTAQLEWIRAYSYSQTEHWSYNTSYRHGTTLVTPPHGYNLLYIARHNSRAYEFLKETVAGLTWKLRFDQSLKTFRLSEIRKDEILDYNLDLLSDSLKRLFFYGAILLTSEKATLVFDEPDVFAFPPYPKTLGEMIAADQSNQFFLTTHNPYFLASLVGKTPTEHFALFVCYRDSEGSTAAKQLSGNEIEDVVEQGPSVFFNLEKFIG